MNLHLLNLILYATRPTYACNYVSREDLVYINELGIEQWLWILHDIKARNATRPIGSTDRFLST